MRTELRIRTAGWSRELVDQAKTALRRLDPNDDHFVYEVVSTSSGQEFTLDELQDIYEESLTEQAEALNIADLGYELAPWDELETEEIINLAETIRDNIPEDFPTPAIQPEIARTTTKFVMFNSDRHLHSFQLTLNSS